MKVHIRSSEEYFGPADGKKTFCWTFCGRLLTKPDMARCPNQADCKPCRKAWYTTTRFHLAEFKP